MGNDAQLSKAPGRDADLSRRGLLKQAGLAMIATACRPWSVFASDQISPALPRLSAYMADARNRGLPEAVTEKLKHHVLDTIASMVSVSELPPGRAAIQFARSYAGEKISTVVASNVLCGPIEAALANGVVAQADETDDSHAPSLSHPGC